LRAEGEAIQEPQAKPRPLLLCSGERYEAALRYIVASRRNGTLYVGVTSDLPKRAYEHREGLVDGFTKKYGCRLLV
jgi:hypothetical protein